MDFSLSQEQLLIQEAARDFAQTELLSGVIARDEAQHFPEALVRKMGTLGFMGMMVSEKYGGSGLNMLSYVLVIEALAKIDASAAVIASVNNSLVCWGLEAFGTAAQKEKYLPLLATGEHVGAFCLSEPEAGSDARAQKTTAVDKGDYYVLNGIKHWVTSGGRAQVFVVMAQTNAAKGSKGISAFLVDKGTEGVSIGTKENKLGIRGSDTHSVVFNAVQVPKANRIGAVGFGFSFALRTLAGGRIGIAAQALGIAAGAYELALNYAKVRKAFGTAIANHQAIAFKLAEMHTQIQAARLMVYQAACDKDSGGNYSLSGAMAKLYASEVAMQTTVEAVQIHGGNGYVKDYHVERLLRDAKITQIYEGTSEIQKLVISRGILKK